MKLREKKINEARSAEDAKRYAQEHEDRVAISSALDRNTEQIIFGDKAADERERNKEKRERVAMLVIVATVVFAGYQSLIAATALDQARFTTMIQTKQTQEALKISREANESTKQQIAVEIDQQRPWISVESIKPSYLRMLTVNGLRQVQLGLVFNLKNRGSSPATNIRVHVSMMPYGAMDENTRKRLATDQQFICNSWKSAEVEDSLEGFTVFPTEKLRLLQSMTATVDGLSSILFSVKGCVIYDYASGREGTSGFRTIVGKENMFGQWSGLPWVNGRFFPPTSTPNTS